MRVGSIYPCWVVRFRRGVRDHVPVFVSSPYVVFVIEANRHDPPHESFCMTLFPVVPFQVLVDAVAAAMRIDGVVLRFDGPYGPYSTGVIECG